jgi:hypothetical protein
MLWATAARLGRQKTDHVAPGSGLATQNLGVGADMGSPGHSSPPAEAFPDSPDYVLRNGAQPLGSRQGRELREQALGFRSVPTAT